MDETLRGHTEQRGTAHVHGGRQSAIRTALSPRHGESTRTERLPLVRRIGQTHTEERFRCRIPIGQPEDIRDEGAMSWLAQNPRNAGRWLHIATLDLPLDEFRVEKTGGNGHDSAWGDANEIMRYIVSVWPI